MLTTGPGLKVSTCEVRGATCPFSPSLSGVAQWCRNDVPFVLFGCTVDVRRDAYTDLLHPTPPMMGSKPEKMNAFKRIGNLTLSPGLNMVCDA